MALSRPAPDTGRPPAARTSGLAAVPFGATRSAARLEALLGNPRDPGNPYGRSRLWAAGYDALPAPPAGLPGTGEPLPAADQLARALRPLFRRDLALAHAWIIRPLLGTPVPHPAAALLGPAALLASVGGVLRSAVRVVDGLGRYEPAAGQWRPVLASVFAELLACESLTAAALRSCPAREPGPAGPGPHGPVPPRRPGRSLAAVVGYLVPQLAGELLGDLELVLNECGFDAGTPERRTLAKILRDREFARVGWTASGAAQARLVRGLNGAGGSWPDDDGTAAAALFRITEAACAPAPGTGCPRAVAATLAGATDRLAGAAGPGAAALARVGRRLVTELRALRVDCAAVAEHDPADPAARALADREALLTLAAAALGVREAAAGARLPFLGETGWALLALGRIAGRLGLPLPEGLPDPQPGVWDELARRAASGVDCDLYATGVAW
ncbi:hypothetical protein [Streptomyces sp. AM6-12]|uniref:hypothetical protein n=1 Tax=Streptomyces sp. AM6-12 TaxID=3345149 RepID=UPI00379B1DCB